MKTAQKNLLLKSLLFDAIGMVTMFVPVVGPFLDIVWAPFAAKKMNDLYPSKEGKIASFVVFVEEILPWTDFVPTFTIMWIYNYFFKTVVSKSNNIVDL